MGKEGEGASKGAQIEDFWARTIGGIDCGIRGWDEVSNGEKGRTTVTEQ